jgi:hypothetical protein
MITSFFLSVAYVWNVYYIVGYAVCLRRLYETRPDAERVNTEKLDQQTIAVDETLDQQAVLAR